MLSITTSNDLPRSIPGILDRLDVAPPQSCSSSVSFSIPNRHQFEPSDLGKRVNEVSPATSLAHRRPSRTRTIRRSD